MKIDPAVCCTSEERISKTNGTKIGSIKASNITNAQSEGQARKKTLDKHDS